MQHGLVAIGDTEVSETWVVQMMSQYGRDRYVEKKEQFQHWWFGRETVLGTGVQGGGREEDLS